MDTVRRVGVFVGGLGQAASATVLGQNADCLRRIGAGGWGGLTAQSLRSVDLGEKYSCQSRRNLQETHNKGAQDVWGEGTTKTKKTCKLSQEIWG